jgi:CBS domain-containing protein
MLALGDALAMVVLSERGFSKEDYARFHPLGALGRKLMKVREVMRRGDELPLVPAGTSITNVLLAMSRTKGRPGAAILVAPDGSLAGLFTDGDLRRLLETGNPGRGGASLFALTRGDAGKPLDARDRATRHCRIRPSWGSQSFAAARSCELAILLAFPSRLSTSPDRQSQYPWQTLCSVFSRHPFMHPRTNSDMRRAFVGVPSTGRASDPDDTCLDVRNPSARRPHVAPVMTAISAGAALEHRLPCRLISPSAPRLRK